MDLLPLFDKEYNHSEAFRQTRNFKHIMEYSKEVRGYPHFR